MIMVPGSVEDKRRFSAMKHLRSPQRDWLQQEHLTLRGSNLSKVWSRSHTQLLLENG